MLVIRTVPTLIAIASMILFNTGAKALEQNVQAELQAEAEELTQSFAMGLGKQLKSAMKAGGPTNAISVCQIEAPLVASDLSGDGWAVGRTSLKTRNPENNPTDWQRAILEDFDRRASAGANPKELVDTQVQSDNGEEVFTYMKAIPAKELCLACHGENLDKAVVAILDDLYPEDQARGYKAGDIRGAFILTKTLEK